MGYESSIKKKSLDGPQDDRKNSSHSSLRFEHSSFMCSQGDNGDLEPVHDLSSSQIYPHNEKSTSLGCDNIPPSAGQSSPQNNNTPDSPICTPQKVLRTPTTYASIKQASGSNLPFQSNYVNNQRDAIIKDLGNGISRGSLEYFKKILPPIRPEFDINKISSHLINDGNLVQEEDIYVWNEFRLATTATTEKRSFSRLLINVFNAIHDAALETSSIKVAPTIDMVTGGDNVPRSVKNSSVKPYGYLILKETEERVSEKSEVVNLWYNIAVSLSLKTVDDSEVKSKSCLNFSSKTNLNFFIECSECCSQYETCISS